MKRGTPRHPKVGDLMQALNIRCRATAVGYLELLWHFTAEFAPQGDVGRYKVERIEAACDWSGKRGKLVDAFTTSGWIDLQPLYNLVVHDWHDHCDDATRKKLQRLGLPFLSLTEKVTGQCQNLSDTQDSFVCQPHAKPLPEPEPLPEPHPKPQTNGRVTSTQQPSLGVAFVSSSVLDFRKWIKPWKRCKDPNEVAAIWQATILGEEDVRGAFAARDRYLASDEVARNVIMAPERFLVEQKKAGWAGLWPEAKPEVRATAAQQRRSEVNAGLKMIEKIRQEG